MLEKLVDTVLRTAIEHAGADRGVLIVPRGDDLRIQAEVRTDGSAIPDRAPRRANRQRRPSGVRRPIRGPRARVASASMMRRREARSRATNTSVASTRGPCCASRSCNRAG